ncbi:MAG TPA: membrane protein insertase YidC [Candidatus Treponema faecavium]|nr:membrane protein insertase YidC [Candidatus Treponema faecavium]
MLNTLYTIIIYPITLLIEIILQFGQKFFDNTTAAIMCVSAAVSLFCLPLYIIAEQWQEKERQTVAKLKPKVDKIKKVFKGDEQYMILTTYYRQNHYHPIYALRSSISLLLQIPFFIAAYTFLSSYTPLAGASFLWIQDLSKPDALVTIGAYSVNVLPIIMTLINCTAGAVYTKGLPLKDKIQLYGMALIFLILLYNSPSGLVLYWTMNNIFSLVKNIFYKLKHPVKVLYLLATAAAVCLILFDIFFLNKAPFKRILFAVLLLIIPCIPLLLKGYGCLERRVLSDLTDFPKKRTALFMLSCLLLCVLIGLNIPSTIIASSPQEFSFVDNHGSPLYFVYTVFLQALGLCVVWPGIFYALFPKRIKTFLAAAAALAAVCAVINIFAFSEDYGLLSTMLTFSGKTEIHPERLHTILNIICIAGIAALCLFLFCKRKLTLIVSAITAAGGALLCISVVNIAVIQKEFNTFAEIKNMPGAQKADTIEPIFHLSKTGKNVFIIMLDRGINSLVPFIFEESPELYEQYDGFVYYPNTLSFSNHTLIGVPPLFGGYEYTPLEMNKRSSETLKDKNNEALLVLPRIFSDAGFQTVMTDPAWGNYSYDPDISFYAPYPDITAYVTKGRYTDIWLQEHSLTDTNVRSRILERNFLLLSLLKISPLFMQDILYDNGAYWSSDPQTADLKLALNSYSVLDYLPRLTDTAAQQPGSFTFMVNDLTHDPAFFTGPDYTPGALEQESQPASDDMFANETYHANAAALKRIGTWLDFLKENGVYDNTRIIITADHGATNSHYRQIPRERFPVNPESYNPILLIKDFNRHSNTPAGSDALAADDTFMTNADVPSLAVHGVIPNPVNPFTGKPITSEAKKHKLYITANSRWTPDYHAANMFSIQPDQWYTVKDNIFDPANWRQEQPAE